MPPYVVEVESHSDNWPKGIFVSIDSPAGEYTCEAFSVEVKGFIARAKDSGLERASVLRFLVEDNPLWYAQIDLARPDIASKKNVEHDDVLCGFNTVLPAFLSLRGTKIDIEVTHEADKKGNRLH